MQIIYFPYLNLIDRDEISFGDIKVWRFETKSTHYITNQPLRDKIKLLIDSNVLHEKPIKGVGVLSIGQTDFREFSHEEFKIADEVRLILFLAYLSRINVNLNGPNAGHYAATSENFTFVIQNFDPTSDYIAEQNGFIVKKLVGGYKIGELLFHAPPFVTTPLKFGIDADLIAKLFRIKQTNRRLYERILRATDLLFESYFNDPYVSINARLLLQVGSFEVLLDLPERDQRKAFKLLIAKYTVISSEKSRNYFSERPGGRNVKETAPLKVMWADKFYTLRNRIIHGDKVDPNDFVFIKRQSHLDISLLFFVLIVKELINEKLRTRRKYFLDNITWGKFENNYGNPRYGFKYEDTSVMRRLSRLRSRH